jgi:uncharacterized protein
MAEWTAAHVNDLPDSAFLYVEAGGELDDEKKTTPRSLRHFPYKGDDGKIDIPHLRDAIGRIPQSDIPADKKKSLQERAQKLLEDENGKSDRGDGQDRVLRLDLSSGKLGDYRATPQGGLIARGNLTRTGVFTYVQPDGSVRRELRHPDDVFEQDSLDSLAHAPVTIDHPDAVTPRNYRQVTVGHVAARPKADGKFVAADDIRLQDADAIDKAKKGQLQEFSCGYSCTLDRTPGEYNGEKYDARQKSIRYNHVAAGPAGWGRAGPEVRMRLDAAGARREVDFAVSGFEGEPSFYVPRRENETMDLAETTRALEATKADLDKLRADSVSQKAELDELRGKVKVFENAKKPEGQTDPAPKAAELQARVDAAVEETIAVRETARRVLGAEWKHDGKSLVEIKREVVKELAPKLENVEKLDGAELEGAYKAATHVADAAHEGRAAVQGATVPHRDAGRGMPENDDDPGNESDGVKKAKDAMLEKRKNAWKTGRKFDRARVANTPRS